MGVESWSMASDIAGPSSPNSASQALSSFLQLSSLPSILWLHSLAVSPYGMWWLMTASSLSLCSRLKRRRDCLSPSQHHTKLHISWRGSCTQIHTMCSQLLGDRECLFASLRHLLTLIDRPTQTMCVGESPQRRGCWADTRPSVSGGEWLLTCREPFQEKSGQNDNRKNLFTGPSGQWVRICAQIHYLSKYVDMGCQSPMYLSHFICVGLLFPTWHHAQPIGGIV